MGINWWFAIHLRSSGHSMYVHCCCCYKIRNHLALAADTGGIILFIRHVCALDTISVSYFCHCIWSITYIYIGVIVLCLLALARRIVNMKELQYFCYRPTTSQVVVHRRRKNYNALSIAFPFSLAFVVVLRRTETSHFGFRGTPCQISLSWHHFSIVSSKYGF
jgi:hypothetical protein